MLNNPLIQKHFNTASKLHQDNNQYYGGIHPYSDHLYDVLKVLYRFGIQNPDIYIAACYHDYLEDIPNVNKQKFKSTIPLESYIMVERVTDEPGENRKERKSKTLVKTNQSHDSVVLKLADRIANLEFGLKNKSNSKAKMYLKEHDQFVDILLTNKQYKEENSSQLNSMWKYYNSNIIPQIKNNIKPQIQEI